ncbi:restriction endonuclease subunit S [Bacillus toyonensis]|uniref:restriction endonuclease subunit S n=1 Tax=Bacillus toyonensis TaxID=155322 RepID=UPI0021D0A86A|nr:restriction endonuclease subunit S [Bacillus toyonensis]MCU5581192.1 restriction endonuclease subunit S [Bacillus toyonensis]HDR3499173.1 restriction endonuclease subunit S [Bacillus toyonensis]
MKNKPTPQIRFSGFTGNWEQRKLNKLVTPVVREVPKPDRPYERISVRSHAKGTFHQKVDDPKTVSMDKLYVVKENDLIVNITFAWEHAIAVASKEDDGLLVSHRFPTFIIDKSDIDFIHYSVSQENFRRKMELISPGGAGRNRVLNKKDFVNLKIDVPTQIEEQTKIGNFLKQLDDTIVLHQKELGTLKQTKKGFLQKMFPKEGEFMPEVRFPGFTGVWEQCKLGQVANITMGQSPNGENYTKNPDDHILVQGNADIKNGWVAPRVWTTQVTKSADKGDIILSVRAPVGDVGKTQYDVVLGRGVAGIKGNEFIFQSLSKMKSNGFWTKYSTGSTFESINSNDLKEAIISVPGEVEQTKIGNFFKQLDDTIALHQRELDALKETKKAFLQKMFV